MVFLRGTDFEDRLIGSSDNDRIIGKLGSDLIAGRDGNDRLTGDTGDPNDLSVGFDDFVFDRDDGTDIITDFQTQCPVCILLPGAPVDEIVLLHATEADIDAVVAGVTTDSKGNAVFTYGETRIVLDSIDPDDVTPGWFIRAGQETDLPTIEGTDCSDKLWGTNGNDQILGFGGNDRIIPRNGDDLMTGGGGADHYVFDRQDGTDTITDFTPWGSPPECEESEVCIAIAVSLDRIVLKGGTQSLKINRKGCGSKDNILLSCVPRNPHFVLESATIAIDFQPLRPTSTLQSPASLRTKRETQSSTTARPRSSWLGTKGRMWQPTGSSSRDILPPVSENCWRTSLSLDRDPRRGVRAWSVPWLS